MEPLPDDITDLLIAYALGDLQPQEQEQVARLLAERPELRQTLAELQRTLSTLPQGLSEAAPPPELRQRVLDRAVGRPQAPAPRQAPGQRLRLWLAGLGSLSTAALVALALTFGQLGAARAELATARQQVAELAALREEVAALQVRNQEIAAAFGLPTLASLSGEGGRATLVGGEGQAPILAAALPPLPDDQVYQLWVIAGESAPVSGGVFTVGADGVGLLPLAGAALTPGVTLAITAEPAPGSAGPTSPVLVAGQVT